MKSGSGYFSSEKYVVTFKKDGYDDANYTIHGSLDGWYIGNILLGGLIGMLIVDPATGAMWKLPDVQSASLNENKSVSLSVKTIDQLSKSEKSKLEKIN